jgi:hypothetical protein
MGKFSVRAQGGVLPMDWLILCNVGLPYCSGTDGAVTSGQ